MISTARGTNGTRCGLPRFILEPGISQIGPSSVSSLISSQRAPTTSFNLVAVKMRNSSTSAALSEALYSNTWMVTLSRSLNRETKDGTLRQSIAAWCLSDDLGLDSSNSRQFFHRAELSPLRWPLAVAQARTNSIRPRRVSAVVARFSHIG